MLEISLDTRTCTKISGSLLIAQTTLYMLYRNCMVGHSFIGDAVIEINENATTPERVRIKDLHLALSDRNALLSGKELTDAIINASQKLLHHQFPRVKGLQETTLSQGLSFVPTRKNAIQIFYVQVIV